MKSKKGIIITIIVVLLLLVVGVTYAFFTYDSGTKSDIVTGQIYMNYEETSTISLTGVFPETKAQALSRQDENGVFEFTITGRNTSKYPVYYEIDLLEGGVITGKTEQSTKILPEHVMIYLEKDGVPVIEGKTYADFNNRRIYTDTIPANQTSNIEHKYTLRMWIDENVTISDTNPNADYTTTEWNDAYASLKVRVVGDFEEKSIPVYLADTIESSLALTEADVDGTRYVYGEEVNNYLWYSDMLWRIVSINEDGSIKLVTENNVTEMAWDSTGNTDYSTSEIRTYLNNDFLGTLNQDLIVDSTWDYTTYASATATKAEPTAYVENEKVGLLTIYDYINSSGAFNGNFGWTMSPQFEDTFVWCVGGGTSFPENLSYNSAVSPSVNLKSDIQVVEGTGEKTNPYTLNGDESGKQIVIIEGPYDEYGYVERIFEGETAQLELIYIDYDGFSDSDITIDDFEFSTDGVVEITNIVKTEISNGYTYLITITGVTSVRNLSTTLTLKEGVISDSLGNGNEAITSDAISGPSGK